MNLINLCWIKVLFLLKKYFLFWVKNSIQWNSIVFVFFAGVYAWIGINFVLGRFNHVEDGKWYCSNFFLKKINSPYKSCFSSTLSFLSFFVIFSVLLFLRTWGSGGGSGSWQWPAGDAGAQAYCWCIGYGWRLHSDRIRSAQNCKLCFSTTGYYLWKFPIFLKAESLALLFSFSHSCPLGTLWSLAQCSTRPWWICWTDALDWDKPAACSYSSMALKLWEQY